MASVGFALREAREARGLSLDEVADGTHIPAHLLKAIEADQFDELPAPVYVRGFVRLFAKSVGLEPAPLVERLDPRWREGPAPGTPRKGTSQAFVRPPSPPGPGNPRENGGLPADAAPPPPVVVAQPGSASTGAAGPEAAFPVIDDVDRDDAHPRPSTGADAARDAARNGDLAGDSQPEQRSGTPLGKLLRWRLSTRVTAVAAVLVVTGAAAAGAWLATRGGQIEAPLPARAEAEIPESKASNPVEPARARPDVTFPIPASLIPRIEPAVETTPVTPAVATPAATPAPAVATAPVATPTSAAAPLAPPVPGNAFAYCMSLGGGVFDCGPPPWRVVCTPAGNFFDPTGNIPRPIPANWTGWSETSLSGRLEDVVTACG